MSINTKSAEIASNQGQTLFGGSGEKHADVHAVALGDRGPADPWPTPLAASPFVRDIF